MRQGVLSAYATNARRRRRRAFTPLTLRASLLAWWDASEGVTVDASSGVSSWVDRVSGYDAVQATGASRPGYSLTGFNGGPGLTFDGTADHLTLTPSPFPSGASPSEIWAVFQQDQLPAVTTGRVVCGYSGDSGNDGRRLQRVVNTGVNRMTSLVGLGASNVSVQNTLVDASGRLVQRGVFGATATSTYMNGQGPLTAAAVPATAALRFRIGAIPSLATPTSAFWLGEVSDVIVTNPLTDAEAAKLFAFLLPRRRN